jgi:hypothetical protein
MLVTSHPLFEDILKMIFNINRALKMRNFITSRLHEEIKGLVIGRAGGDEAISFPQRSLRSTRNNASVVTEKPGSYFVHNP